MGGIKVGICWRADERQKQTVSTETAVSYVKKNRLCPVKTLSSEVNSSILSYGLSSRFYKGEKLTGLGFTNHIALVAHIGYTRL